MYYLNSTYYKVMYVYILLKLYFFMKSFLLCQMLYLT